MKKVLVIGANGSTGTHIAKKLKGSSEFEPIAMIRNEEQKSKFDDLGVQSVQGDLEGDIDDAVKSADHVIFAAGSGSSTGTDKTYAVDRDGAIKSIDKSKEHGIEKYVMLSSMGAHDPQIVKEGAFHDYLVAKHEADEHLKKSGLDYTIVRPGALTKNDGKGKIQAAPHLNKQGEISREDVAEVMIHALSNNGAKNQTFEILEGDSSIDEAIINLG
jgi:uncharacterized protein YbjT (DUF2867 family)